jgi:choline kinase
VSVADRALIDHILAALRTSGIRRVHVVTGYESQAIRRHVQHSAEAREGGSLEVAWLENPDFERPNGLSLLAADGHVRPPFVLLMADHLFEVLTLREFLANPVPPGGGVLAVDSKIEQVFDLPDATKARRRGPELEAVGKDLSPFDAIDSGMFLFGEAIFPAMRDSAARGEESLSDGVNQLARRRAMRAWDIGDRVWIDVDTPGAWAEAQRLALQGRFR